MEMIINTKQIILLIEESLRTKIMMYLNLMISSKKSIKIISPNSCSPVFLKHGILCSTTSAISQKMNSTR